MSCLFLRLYIAARNKEQGSSCYIGPIVLEMFVRHISGFVCVKSSIEEHISFMWHRSLMSKVSKVTHGVEWSVQSKPWI